MHDAYSKIVDDGAMSVRCSAEKHVAMQFSQLVVN